MKIDPHSQKRRSIPPVKPKHAGRIAVVDRPTHSQSSVAIKITAFLLACLPVGPAGSTHPPIGEPVSSGSATTVQTDHDAGSRLADADDASVAGKRVIDQVLDRLAFGPAFDAKIRKRVWASNREIVGVGTYEQAGRGSGMFTMQVTMHDGEGKHTLQQISDGRLAWTRSVIADKVLLRRVDVRMLEQRIRDADLEPRRPPRVIVGGLTELLDTIRQDYDLQLRSGKFQLRTSGDSPTDRSQTFLVVAGELYPTKRQAVLESAGRTDWPSLCPSHVQILIATEPNPDTGFGEGLPRRIYFFSDPITSPDAAVEPSTSAQTGPLIGLVELYSIHPTTAPSPERFSFENRDENNDFVIETQRYLKRYGLR